MILFEIKKIFSKTSNKIAVLILMAVLIMVFWTAIRSPEVNFVNSYGEREVGISAAHSLREAKKEWAGTLTEDKIKEAIKENTRINNTIEANSDDIVKQDIAFGWKQGIMDIYDLLGESFVPYGQYDYYKADSLKTSDAEDFYSNRTEKFAQWTKGGGEGVLTEGEQSYILQKYSELKTPFNYDYADGWKQLLGSSPMLLVMTALILSFIMSGVFSGEFALKADPIFFSSRYGRSKAIWAKLKAAIITVTVIYIAVMAIYTAVILICLGADGGNCPIQTEAVKWYSIYNITFVKAYALIVLGGYIGTLAVSLISMLISVKTRSAILAAVIPFVLLLMPSYIPDTAIPVIRKIAGLLPDQLLQLNLVLGKFNLYGFGDNVTGAANLLPVIYLAVVLILCPVIFLCYRKLEAK